MSESYCEIVITAPDAEWLTDLTRQLVHEGLCASAHNFTPVRSIYRWQGEVHERTEGRASLHTRRSLVPAIVARVKAVHPYEVPDISARPIVDGNPDYLRWILDETEHVEAPSQARARHHRGQAQRHFASAYRTEHHETSAALAEAPVTQYLVIIERDEEGGYSAWAPDLPGVVAAADTYDECLQLMREAVAFHLEGMREDGEPIPQPSTVAATVVTLDAA